MDPIIQLYEAMKRALADGYSIAEVNAELARRGYTFNNAPGTFSDLADQAQRAMQEQARGPVTGKGILGAATHAATLGADKYILGAMAAANPTDAAAFGGDPNAPASERYRGARDVVRGQYEDFRSRRPGVTMATELAAGLATTPAFGGPAKTLMGSLGKAALVGGAYGGISGALDAPEGDHVSGGLRGAAAGAALALPFALMGRMAPSLRARGRAYNRMSGAIEAEGGPEAVRAAAGRTNAAGYGNVNPVGSLGPYLRGEAEQAATRSPSVQARYRDRFVSRQMDESDRLLRKVSEAFHVPEIGREALKAARRAQFDPVYAALAKTAGRIEDPRVQGILDRPVVRAAFQEAINTGIIADRVESLPGFGQLNELREVLYSIGRSLESNPGGNKRRMAAIYDAARDIEAVLEDNVDGFRAVQSAYRDASRPINVIDLARLETAKAGRVSPAVYRASRDLRRELLNAFGSADKYKRFMRAVEQERQLADFNTQVFGGAATARRLEGTSEMRPEDLAHTIAYPVQGATNIAGKAVGRSSRDATARALAPWLMAPSSDIDRVLADVLSRAPRRSNWIGQVGLPAAGGILLGDWLNSPEK